MSGMPFSEHSKVMTVIEKVVDYHNRLAQCETLDERLAVLDTVAKEPGGKDVINHHLILTCKWPDLVIDSCLRTIDQMNKLLEDDTVETFEDARAEEAARIAAGGA